MRQPDKSGTGCMAWKVTWPAKRKSQQGAVSQWLVKGAFHPFWDQWVVAAISLKDIEGVPPAKKHKPEYTHEIIIFSVDPRVKVDPDVLPKGGFAMDPPDLVKQFTVPEDKDAAWIVEAMIIHICNGQASPDSDWKRYWEETIERTAAHQRGEHEKCKH